MHLFVPFLMAVGPALFLVRFFYLKDHLKPEPIGLILKVFGLGILSTVPIILFGYIGNFLNGFFTWSPLLFIFFKAFFVAGFCEEWIKQQVVTIYVYEDKHFDEVVDGVVYTIVASLGFACMENIMYVAEGGVVTAYLRAFTSIPLHAGCSGLMGYYIGKAKFAKTPKETKFLLRKGLIIAVILHGLYDFLIFAAPIIGQIYTILISPILIYIYIVLINKIKDALKEDVDNNRVGNIKC